MRWDRLFADLDAQLAAADAVELAGEVTDRTRREVARLHLADRARLAVGAEVSVGLGPAGTVTGRLESGGPGWWLLRVEAGMEALVCTDAVAWVTGLPALAADPDAQSPVAAKLGRTTRYGVWRETACRSPSCCATRVPAPAPLTGSVPTSWTWPNTPRASRGGPVWCGALGRSRYRR